MFPVSIPTGLATSWIHEATFTPTALAGAAEMATQAIGVDVPVVSGTEGMMSILATATTSMILSATATVSASPTATPTAGSGDEHGPGAGGSGECRLLGPFALLVQLALGGLALLSLVYKRWRERPQRPLKIWFFDVSKQVVGSILVHIANVFMSMLTSGRLSIKANATTVQNTARAVALVARLLRRDGGGDEDAYVPNPCSFYLLNLGIDTTLGIPVLIILLRITTVLVSYTPWGKPAESIQSGHYGSPPNVVWWLKQSFIYFCGLCGMKICVLILFLVLPWISRVGDWALKWTEGNEKLQIVFVMMLFPLIMNAMQYYIIDSFIKKKETSEHGHQPLPGDDHDDDLDRANEFDAAELLDSEDEGPESDVSNDSIRMSKSRKSLRKDKQDVPREQEEYNPDLDGQVANGSGTGGRVDKGKLLPKELAPAE